MSDILESLGYLYETVKDGYEAFLALRDRHFDLILMDIQMPNLNGFEAAEFIRRTLSYPKNAIPIIVMTGWEFASEISKTYKEEGFDGFIKKPFSIDTLDELLDELLQNKEKNKM